MDFSHVWLGMLSSSKRMILIWVSVLGFAYKLMLGRYVERAVCKGLTFAFVVGLNFGSITALPGHAGGTVWPPEPLLPF